MKDFFNYRDRMVGGITENGHFTFSIMIATQSVEAARTRHELAPPAAIILGELMIGTTLAASKFKGEERVILRMDSNGPLKMAVAESNGTGEVRGYVSNPQAVATGESLDEALSATVGIGLLSFTKIIRGSRKPMQSTVELRTGRLVKDLAYFYSESEQVPTALRIKVELGEDDKVNFAWGVLVQAMPGATESELALVEERMKDPKLIEVPKSETFYHEVAQKILGDSADMKAKELRRYPVDFYCRCSRERFEDNLLTIGRTELLDMAAQGTQEIVCHYCNEKYYFNPDALTSLADKAKPV